MVPDSGIALDQMRGDIVFDYVLINGAKNDRVTKMISMYHHIAYP